MKTVEERLHFLVTLLLTPLDINFKDEIYT